MTPHLQIPDTVKGYCKNKHCKYHSQETYLIMPKSGLCLHCHMDRHPYDFKGDGEKP